MSSLCGGVSPGMPIDGKVTEVFARVADYVTASLKLSSPADIKLISYKSQVVAGMNYFVTVEAVSTGKHYEVCIYEDIHGSVSFSHVTEL